MDPTLFVIVGAGASYDASTEWAPAGFVKPPLVKDLFDSDYREILARYPLAQNAAPEIRDAIRGGPDNPAVSLEHHLRSRYRDSADPYDRRRFFSIALYLQDLLWNASSTERVHFDNMDRLVAALPRHFHHICFLTLNYDLILDRALNNLDSIKTMGDYIGYGRWSLIKLHGSVDWGFAPIGDVSVDSPPADLSHKLGSRIQRATDSAEFMAPPSDAPPRYVKRSALESTKLFPALAVPVGEEDDVICPGSHQSYLDERLRASEELDLLILGYSAYDRTVIDRIRRSEKRIRSLTVVNAGPATAEAVIQRLKELLPQTMSNADISVARQSFSGWCQESLPLFVSSHPAAH